MAVLTVLVANISARQTLFEEILPFESEIRKYGFKYPPFAETVYICQGAFYEKIFEALSLPGGVLDIGYTLSPVKNAQFEDFDYVYEGTNVYVDVKGYSQTRELTTKEKLWNKIIRCKDRCAVVYINTKVCDTAVYPSEPAIIHEEPIENSLYLVHGIGSRHDRSEVVKERAKRRMGEVKRLCDKYRRKEKNNNAR